MIAIQYSLRSADHGQPEVSTDAHRMQGEGFDLDEKLFPYELPIDRRFLYEWKPFVSRGRTAMHTTAPLVVRHHTQLDWRHTFKRNHRKAVSESIMRSRLGTSKAYPLLPLGREQWESSFPSGCSGFLQPHGTLIQWLRKQSGGEPEAIDVRLRASSNWLEDDELRYVLKGADPQTTYRYGTIYSPQGIVPLRRCTTARNINARARKVWKLSGTLKMNAGRHEHLANGLSPPRAIIGVKVLLHPQRNR
jgi:hypothetical protein